jgi:ribonuclease P protein component
VTEYRKVYDKGFRVYSPYFAAFCLANEGQQRPKVGFTTPKALGKSVLRNRLKRRLREAVRLNLDQLGPNWSIVFNIRRQALDGPFEALVAEVRKLFSQCASW